MPEKLPDATKAESPALKMRAQAKTEEGRQAEYEYLLSLRERYGLTADDFLGVTPTREQLLVAYLALEGKRDLAIHDASGVTVLTCTNLRKRFGPRLRARIREAKEKPRQDPDLSAEQWRYVAADLAYRLGSFKEIAKRHGLPARRLERMINKKGGIDGLLAKYVIALTPEERRKVEEFWDENGKS